MAKRAPADERPFRPLDMTLLHSVVQHVSENRSEGGDAPASVSQQVVSIRSERPFVQTPQFQRLDKEKRVLYTRDERQALDRLVSNLAVRLQAQIKASHVLRALTSLLLHAESEIDRRAGERGPITRPANGDLGALERFECEIALLLSDAIRDAGPPRVGG